MVLVLPVVCLNAVCTQISSVVPSVPPGNYYLRIEPEGETFHRPISYVVTLKRDVPQISFFGIASLALVIPAAFLTWRAMSFEHLRWAESDYGKAPDDGSVLSTAQNLTDSFRHRGENE